MKVLFIPYKDASFVKADKEILESLATVLTCRLEWSLKVAIPFSFFRQFVWLLIHITNADLVVCSFAGYSSVIPAIMGSLFNRKVVTIVHGTECAAIKPINYGMTRKWLLQKCIGSSLRFSDKVIISNEKLIASKDTYSNGLVGPQGLAEYYSLSSDKLEVVNYEIGSSFWNLNNSTRKRNSFTSVVLPGQELRRDLASIYRIAQLLPEFKFRVVGLNKSAIDSVKPDNVELLGILDKEQLKQLFNQTDFFLQLSLYEGFGLSLVEAMLCGCIPIASDVNEVPIIVGESGYMISTRDEKTMLSVIEKAVVLSIDVDRQSIRDRVMKLYPTGTRKKALQDLAKELTA